MGVWNAKRDVLECDEIYPIAWCNNNYKKLGQKRIYTINDIQFLLKEHHNRGRGKTPKWDSYSKAYKKNIKLNLKDLFKKFGIDTKKTYLGSFKDYPYFKEPIEFSKKNRKVI